MFVFTKQHLQEIREAAKARKDAAKDALSVFMKKSATPANIGAINASNSVINNMAELDVTLAKKDQELDEAMNNNRGEKIKKVLEELRELVGDNASEYPIRSNPLSKLSRLSTTLE